MTISSQQSFSKGDRVRHFIFGVGTVHSQKFQDTVAVNFDSDSRKAPIVVPSSTSAILPIPAWQAEA